VSAGFVRALCLAAWSCFVAAPPLVGAQDAPDTQDAPVAAAAADRARAALARTVASLPRADVGTWEGWHTRPMPGAYLAALEAYRGDDVVTAWRLAFECLDAAPDHPASLSLVGGLAFRLRRHQDAIDAFERFLQHAPEEVARTRHLGHAYHGLGRHAEARAHYARVLAAPDVAPNAAREARFGLALAAYRLGDVESARTELDRVLADTPDDVEALTWRATIAFEDEELGAAQSLAERAAALAPFDPKPVFLLARVLSEQLAELDLEPPGAAPPEADPTAVAAAERQRARVLAERARELEETRARFALLSAADARSRELEATLTLDAQDVATRMELARLRAAIGDGASALRHVALLARLGSARHDAQIVVLEVLAVHGRPASAAAHARLLEATYGAASELPVVTTREAIDVLEALERFYAQRGDVQARLRTGARAAELRQRSPE